ncbi:ABC transporter permease [Nitratiruptor sp. SB155-2]|uniref:ABC transporter permease n=1 Tax=Nitratiruptor sp. (strain SB155-2) TaxID=387092 RepID=UPI0001587405|nr:ABC transporter permease [Nitratiruptor sp. SB155-2]BAF70779.1 antimicrobial peptide ABC transporter, permease [Nitratiruptor sp. SB155-2]
MVRFYLRDLFAFLFFYKGRTLFALLGIVLGIASLVFIVAAIEGSQLKAKKIIDMLGSDTILIRSSFGSRVSFRHIPMKLDIHQYNLIKKIDGIKSLDYFYVKKVNVKRKNFGKKLLVEGFTLGTLEHFGYRPKWGRFFLPKDFQNFSKVVVVGQDIVQEFFQGKNPLGKTLFIGKEPFRVIGVYQKRGKSPRGNSMDERIMMPVSTYRKFIQHEYQKIFAMVAKVSRDADYKRVLNDIETILNKTLKPDDYFLITPQKIMKFLSMLSTSLTLFLGIASFTALFVSGFVLSNIFLINNKTRAWELGLRRAIGATKKDIFFRIIFEASVIALMGALLGTLFGFLSVHYILPLLKIPVLYPIKAFFIATIFSIVTAFLAASSPAKEAASLNPIEALRQRI